MSGVGSAGTKFALIFEVTGSGEADLRKIKLMMKGIAAQAGEGGGSGLAGADGPGATSVLKGWGKAFGGARLAAAGHIGAIAAGISTTVQTVVGGLERVAAFGTGLIATGAGITQSFVQVGQAVLNAVAPLETMILQMQALGGLSKEQALTAARQAQNIVDFTPFAQHQVLGIQQALVAGKVALDDYKDSAGKVLTLNDMISKGFSKVDATTAKWAGRLKVNATTLVADLAAMTGQVGQQMDFFLYGFQRALATGSAALLRDQLPHDMLMSIFGSTGKITKKASEVMDDLYKMLKQKGAIGASAMASGTYAAIMQGFAEIPATLALAIGGLPGEGGFYDQLKEALGDLYSSIYDTISDPEWQTALRETLIPTLNAVISVIQGVGQAVGWLLAQVVPVANMFKDALGFGPMIGLGIALAGVLTLIVGVGIPLVAIFGLLMTLLVILSPVIISLTLAGVGLAYIFGAIAVAVGLVGGALIAGVAALGYFTVKTEPFQRFWEKTRTLVGAVVEALRNWSGETTTISAETAQGLEKSGLLSTFQSIVQMVRRAEVFAQKLWTILGLMAKNIVTRLQEPVQQVAEAFVRLGKTVAVAFQVAGLSAFGDNLESAEGTANGFRETIHSVGNAISILLSVMARMVTFTLNAMNGVIEVYLLWNVIVARIGYGFAKVNSYLGLAIDGLNIMQTFILAAQNPMMRLVHAARALMAALSGDPKGLKDALETMKSLGDPASWTPISSAFAEQQKLRAAEMEQAQLSYWNAKTGVGGDVAGLPPPSAGWGGNVPAGGSPTQGGGPTWGSVPSWFSQGQQPGQQQQPKIDVNATVKAQLVVDGKILADQVIEDLKRRGDISFNTPQ